MVLYPVEVRKQFMNDMEPISIKYCFKLPWGKEEVFSIALDPQKIELLNAIPNDLPEWTKLDYHQCPNCTLSTNDHPHCPLIASLVDLVGRFGDVISYDELDVEVTTEERHISKHASAQRGISSLMGLVIGTCGCPHTAFFKPMARFHLPFSSDDETVYRAVSTYLLAQYFRAKDGQKVDFDLAGLNRIYEEIHEVNVAVAERLRAATETDSPVNAIVILDLFTIFVPMGIESSLDEIRYLFDSFLSTSNEEN